MLQTGRPFNDHLKPNIEAAAISMANSASATSDSAGTLNASLPPSPTPPGSVIVLSIWPSSSPEPPSVNVRVTVLPEMEAPGYTYQCAVSVELVLPYFQYRAPAGKACG